jgi:glutathione S-transferase
MADNLKITLDLKDISEDESALNELLEKGGKQQVPFLVDTERGVSMYESSDIIDYFKEHGMQASPVVVNKPRVHVGGSTCESCEG